MYRFRFISVISSFQFHISDQFISVHITSQRFFSPQPASRPWLWQKKASHRSPISNKNRDREMFNHFISRKFQYNLLYLYIFIYNFITCIFSLPLIWCFKTWWFDYLNTEIFRHGTVHPWPVKLPSLMSPHQQYHVSHTDSLVRTSKVQDPEVQNDQTWHDLVWAVYTRTRHYSTVMQMENRIGYRRPPNNLTGKKRKGSAKSLGYLKKTISTKTISRFGKGPCKLLMGWGGEFVLATPQT